MSVVIDSLHLRSLLRGYEQNHTGEWPLFSKHFEIPNDRNGHDGDVVRELYGVMAAKGAAGGFIVTSGSFTQEAQEFAQGRNVKLLNGPQLHALLKRASKDEKGRITTNGGDASRQPQTHQKVRAPACLLCSKPMVIRTAKRGQQAGRTFRGCTGCPAGKGSRQTD